MATWEQAWSALYSTQLKAFLKTIWICPVETVFVFQARTRLGSDKKDIADQVSFWLNQTHSLESSSAIPYFKVYFANFTYNFENYLGIFGTILDFSDAENIYHLSTLKI